MLNLPKPFCDIPFQQLRYDSASPVHPLANGRINANAEANASKLSIWVKREDQSSSLLCCGNKYRKLEYIIPDIQKNADVTTIVTEGGLQSNHAAQVAVVASRLGLECTLILDRSSGGFETSDNQACFSATGNHQIHKLLGADIKVFQGECAKENVLAELESQGKKTYWIPAGASLHPLGGLGYARCAYEIAAQEPDLGLPGSKRFDYIFVACGSGSTLAGLVAGFALLEAEETSGSLPPRQLIGIMVSPKARHEQHVLSIAQAAGQLIGLPDNRLRGEDIRLDDRFIGPGYGVLDDATRCTLERLACTDGLLLDPVYSGKAANGMLHWVTSGELAADAVGHGFGL
ncbi:hypothetical protein G7054_g7727 [Neopestalotiopsis clavispora]|nr:hypothetical protein G7054_g7727 [Neopestalotiopsis clavispora]